MYFRVLYPTSNGVNGVWRLTAPPLDAVTAGSDRVYMSITAMLPLLFAITRGTSSMYRL